ncbi:MAG TPA: hypothetical protein VGI03_04695 [Verrucomicrobiae bacterium]
MSKSKSQKANQTAKQYVLAPTETDAGVFWLNSLTEVFFRDQVLEHLFRKMEKENVLAWYSNIHGRNDKGVDFLLVVNSDFGQRIIGVQAKSKEVTRAGSGSNLSALQIKQECEGAMKHEFDVQKNKARLDNIELWCSSNITEDAEKEFNASGDNLKIQVKKASQIFSLVEKFAPDLLKKIPQCALASFVRDKRNPPPKKIKLLGCELHPKKHFLEPTFSKHSYGSAAGIQKTNSGLRRNAATVSIGDILFSNEHALVTAPELSGKTYLLEHIECLIAEAQAVPIVLHKDDFADGKITSIYSLVSKKLGFYSAHDIEELVKNVRLFLLVDDIDLLSDETRQVLFSQNAEQLKVIATTTRSINCPSSVEAVYMTGVNLGSVTKFLRGLDAKLADSKAFIDRAHSFISRTLATSGLPSNPFTISMMLAECQNSPQKFSTPTMGRLIERFVEMQLGSHSDNTIQVDFETKREFLTKLGGRRNSEFTLKEFKRELVKFIEGGSHPHTVDDFLLDLNHSGVFIFDGEKVRWSHPALKQYYWVKNLVKHDNLNPILEKLRKEYNLTLAALTGSQMQNGGKAIEVLVKELDKIKLPTPKVLLEVVKDSDILDLLRSDEAEEQLLSRLEQDGLGADESKERNPIISLAEYNLGGTEEFPGKTVEGQTGQTDDIANMATEGHLDAKASAELKRRLEPLMSKMAESKLHIAFNLASLLVNARNTKTATKQDCVRHILKAQQFMGHWFQDLIEAFFAESKKAKFDAIGARVFTQLMLTDRMIGDPFLVNVFKKMLGQAKSDEETLMLLDLLLGCGEDDYQLVVEKLRKIVSPELIVPFYLRVTVLYFFRFHRDKDRKALRELLKTIRRNTKSIRLLPVTT